MGKNSDAISTLVFLLLSEWKYFKKKRHSLAYYIDTHALIAAHALKLHENNNAGLERIISWVES